MVVGYYVPNKHVCVINDTEYSIGYVKYMIRGDQLEVGEEFGFGEGEHGTIVIECVLRRGEANVVLVRNWAIVY